MYVGPNQPLHEGIPRRRTALEPTYLTNLRYTVVNTVLGIAPSELGKSGQIRPFLENEEIFRNSTTVAVVRIQSRVQPMWPIFDWRP